MKTVMMLALVALVSVTMFATTCNAECDCVPNFSNRQVCGNDGVTYDSSCMADCLGGGVAFDAPCDGHGALQ